MPGSIVEILRQLNGLFGGEFTRNKSLRDSLEVRTAYRERTRACSILAVSIRSTHVGRTGGVGHLVGRHHPGRRIQAQIHRFYEL